jgi:hypothetical protein
LREELDDRLLLLARLRERLLDALRPPLAFFVDLFFRPRLLFVSPA